MAELGLRRDFVAIVTGFLFILTSILASAAIARADSTVSRISVEHCSTMRSHKVLKTRPTVPCDRLRQVNFSYFGFDDQLHDDGQLVVMDVAADHVAQIFNALRDKHFPIARARLMENYDGDDDASMADDNTSAFNDRTIKGGASQSLHAYGLAIDLNPLQNPSIVRGGKTAQVEPIAGGEYLDRSSPRNGMAESVIEIFADHGFLIWGGRWRNPIDYQHFQVDRDLAKALSANSPERAQILFDSYVERYRACKQATARQNSNDRCRRGARP
jgi:hypothetical protein